MTNIGVLFTFVKTAVIVCIGFVLIIVAVLPAGASSSDNNRYYDYVASDMGSPYCPASSCNPGETCCTIEGGQPGCCPLVNATCCGVQNSCCANGLICDPVMRDCVPPDTSQYCSDCESVVNHLVDYGCDYACDLLPDPLNLICSLIVDDVHLCEQILNWTTNGLSPKSICMMVGICGGGTCSCGYCTQYLHGRCLSLPNHCPSGTTSGGGSTASAGTSGGSTTTGRSSSATTGSSRLREDHPFNGARAQDARVGNPLICVDNTCSKATEGCCLTCF